MARCRAGATVVVTALALALLGAGQPTLGAPAVPRPAGPPAPNVVLVMMDDMRADDLPWLPTVADDIVARGVSYSHFYAPTALCCPSRASVLRGQYPHNTTILENTEPGGGFAGSLRIDDQTLATWLDPTYRTGYVGKYFNGYESPTQTYIPPGWDAWWGSLHTYAYTNSLTNHDGVPEHDRGPYNSDVFAEQAVDFIESSAPAVEPYFLHLSFVAPHHGPPHTDGDAGRKSPYVPPPFQGTYAGPRFVDTPSFNERDVSDKTGPVADRSRLSWRERKTLALQTAQRREALQASDAAIARVLAAVEASGEGGSTYVLFVSDNGMLLGEHRYRMTKNSPYEASSRLPFAIRGPGLTPGSTVDAMAGTMDVAPTVLDLAGVEPPLELDGRSVVPAEVPPARDDRAILLMASARPTDPENGGEVRSAPRLSVAETPWKYRGLVTARWKLLNWSYHDAWELYDLRRDPDELRNLAGRARWARVESTLQQRFADLWGCAGRACDQ